jgi:2-hydroxychromene-2-carboxylate isomerase
MSNSVDVFWSFRSPYSYLATPEMLELGEKYDVEVNLRVVLPLALRNPDILFDKSKDSENRVKYILMDWQRRAEMLGLPHKWPSPDPIVMDLKTMAIAEDQPYIYRLSYLGVEAQRRGRGVEFAAAVSGLIWGGTANWNEGDIFEKTVTAADFDLESMESFCASGDHQTEIEKNQQLLDDAGHWGVPTLVFEGETFFGQDRIDTLRWRLDQLGLGK